MRKLQFLIFFCAVISITTQSKAQESINPLRFNLSKDSTRFIQFNGLAQVWGRYIQNNPGSTLYGEAIDHSYDIGIRRLRVMASGQLAANTSFYFHAGLNNLYNLSARKQGVFVHDMTVEHKVLNEYIVLGGGLHGWNGTNRFSSSSTSSILALDIPMVDETTNDISDQFGRKYGVYAKGMVHRLAYQVAVSKPFPLQTSANPIAPVKVYETYISTKAPKLNFAGYSFWQFFDKESLSNPYKTGSYLGKKKVLNVGAGFQYQKDFSEQVVLGTFAFHTLSYSMKMLAMDVYFDSYLSKEKRNALSFYGVLKYTHYGPGYTRNLGVMNVANGSADNAVFSGFGNAYPLYGTGTVGYAQAAYKFREGLIGQSTLQPYMSASIAKFDRLNNKVDVYHIGCNVLLNGHHSKISIDYELRPYFISNGGYVDKVKNDRLGAFVLQYQIAI